MTREQQTDEAVRNARTGLNARNAARCKRGQYGPHYETVGNFLSVQYGSVKTTVAVAIVMVIRAEFRRIAEAA